MNAALKTVERFRPRLLIAAVAGAVIAVGVGVVAHDSWAAACRFVLFACLAPAIGSMLFSLIHELTGGEWGKALRPFLAGGSWLAPRIWVLALPLLLVLTVPHASWPHYSSRGMLAIRGVAYGGILFFFARPLSRPQVRAAPWVGPAGFIITVFMLHLLAEDWLSSLDSGWHSTTFPLVWMTGLCVSGLACALISALACGASPRTELPEPRTLGIEWGNLMLAAMLFWCYVAFAQFLIIWAGNLPSEISWFTTRTRGGWGIVPVVLALIHLVVPMTVLLSRTFKLSKAMITGVAATLIAAQIVYIAWIILPAYPAVGPAALVMSVALFAAGAALFLHVYLGASLRRLEKS